MLKSAYFSSVATFASTPLYLFASEVAHMVVFGLLGVTVVFAALGLARRR
jgi:hypothetical protein